MRVNVNQVVFCYIIIFFLSVVLSVQAGKELVINHAEDNYSLQSFVGDSFFLEELAIDKNSFEDIQEIQHLLGICEQSIVSASMLERGLGNIFKKNKYALLHLKLEDGVVGKKLFVRADPLWTVRKVTVSGIVIGKEFYKNCYVLEPGDIFDEKKHYHALTRIRHELRKDGYMRAQLNVSVVPHEDTKTVDVQILIVPGKQFSIGTVSLTSKDCFDEYQDIFKEAERYLLQTLGKRGYSWNALNKATSQLKSFLMKHGICSVKILLSESVDMEKNRVNLQFSLESLEKRLFNFFGNVFFSDNQLQDVIASFGSAIAAVPSSMIVQEITEKYHAKGFWNVHIQAQEASQSECFILIHEGPRAYIKSVGLEGVHADRVGVVSKYAFTPCVQKYFDADLVKKSIEQMSTWYAQEGFWHMRILAHEYILNGDDSYTLKVFVDEGEQCFVSGLVVDGFPDLEREGPLGLYLHHIRQNGRIVLDMTIIQEQKRWLLDYFHSRGYLQAEIHSDLQGKPDDLTIVWYINPGPLTYFGKTVVQGAQTIPYTFIARELHYKEGNIWDSKKLRASLLRLKELGIFSTVHMHPDHEQSFADESSAEQDRTVILKIRPEDPFEVRLRAGMGLQQVGKNFVLGRGLTYKLGGTFLCKNPFKHADCFLLDLDFARSHQTVNVEYRTPWLLHMPIRFVVKGYSNSYNQPGFVGSKEPLYRIIRQGFLVGLTRCGSGFEFVFNTGFEWLKTTVEPDQQELAERVGHAINFKPSLLDEKIPYLQIEPSLVIDRVDNRLCPRKGSFTLLVIKAMLPMKTSFSDAYFVRVQLDQSLFIPIAQRLIAGFRVRLGHMFHDDFSLIMPAERFYLGGANSVRGYDTDLCPPLGTYKDEDQVERVAPQGGKTMVNFNVELRFLWYRMLEVALFQDAGLLVGSGCARFEKDHAVAATGFGVRYNTPIGPLRFDIAWKWRTTRKDERSYAWFLRLGHVF